MGKMSPSAFASGIASGKPRNPPGMEPGGVKTRGGRHCLENYTYTYDSASRVVTMTLNGTSEGYGYDNTDQVTSAGTYTYGFDLNGNRTMGGYTTGTGNRMTNDGTFTYTWDDEGNLTKKSKAANDETWTFGYDTRNQLTSVEKRSQDGGGTLLLRVTYTYDVWNNQVQEDKYDGSSTTTTRRAFLQKGVVFADLDNSNALKDRYLHAGDGEYPSLVVRIGSGGAAAWLLADKLGSVRHVVNGSGTLIATVAYDAFGGIITDTSAANAGRFGFTGLAQDRDTGLVHAFWRDLGVAWGGWLQQDPIRWEAGDTHLGRYVRNNSTNLVDPNGLDWAAADVEKYLQISPIGQEALSLLRGGSIRVYQVKEIAAKYYEEDPKTGKPVGKEQREVLAVDSMTDSRRSQKTIYVKEDLPSVLAAVAIVREIQFTKMEDPTATLRVKIRREENQDVRKQLMKDLVNQALLDEIKAQTSESQFVIDLFKFELFKKWMFSFNPMDREKPRIDAEFTRILQGTTNVAADRDNPERAQVDGSKVVTYVRKDLLKVYRNIAEGKNKDGKKIQYVEKPVGSGHIDFDFGKAPVEVKWAQETPKLIPLKILDK
jgi:RHS repeat-associated protein